MQNIVFYDEQTTKSYKVFKNQALLSVAFGNRDNILLLTLNWL